MIKKSISTIIRARKSVFPRDFNGQTIRKEDVLEILQNANTAPTHKLTQPWLFKVFSGESKIKLASEIIKSTLPELSELKKEQIHAKFKVSSHVICVCMRRDVNNSIPEWEEIAATAMAVQNIWLSCVDSNIGGYWSTPRDINHLHKFLKLSKNERCLGLFYLGLFDQARNRIIKRKDIQEDIDWYE